MKDYRSPKDRQVGGDHYKVKGIQPIDYIHANNLNFEEGNIVKYITRHRDKDGARDIEKIIHYCEIILEHEYGKKQQEQPEEKPGNDHLPF